MTSASSATSSATSSAMTTMTTAVSHQRQVAVVTGAAHGIGLAISQQLAAKGIRVVMADLAGDELTTAVRQVQALFTLHATTHPEATPAVPATMPAATHSTTLSDSGAIAFVGDLSQEAVVNDLLTLTRQQFGPATILINNAGGGVIRPFLSHTAETLRATIDYLDVRSMIVAAYNAAKGGVHGLTTGLAREFASVGITVNTVAPCAVNTAALDHVRAVNPVFARQVLEVIPMGRPAEVDEVAAMTVFLASAEAAFVTGQVISVNGGSTML